MDLSWNAQGLLPAIAQDARDGTILMQAWVNQEALDQTLRTRVAHFFSRSRNCLWKKGETSGNQIAVDEIWTDCDKDTILYLTIPSGPSCHTGTHTCFMNPLLQSRGLHLALPESHILTRLDETFANRSKATEKTSYVKSLLEKGPKHLAAKIREEAEELAVEIESGQKKRSISESADLIFHLLVALHGQGSQYTEVLAELQGRFGKSGHQEKAERASKQ